MKGLASTNSSFARVTVSGRSARKHYGLSVVKPYDPAQHSHIAEHRYVGKEMTLSPRGNPADYYL